MKYVYWWITVLFERDSCSRQHAEIIDQITWLWAVDVFLQVGQKLDSQILQNLRRQNASLLHMLRRVNRKTRSEKQFGHAIFLVNKSYRERKNEKNLIV